MKKLKTKLNVGLSKTIQERSYEPISANISIEIDGEYSMEEIREEFETLREVVVEELEELLVDWKMRGDDED